MTDLFNFTAPSNHFAVMGNPIAHSRSPQIHLQFARQFDIELKYEKIQVDVGGFEQAVSHFAAHGGAGLNVTVPFKVEAWKMCAQGKNKLSARAQLAEAVNTLRCEDKKLFGDNTDGIGLVRDIENNLRVKIADKRVLILGAGGAVRGVLGAIVKCQPRAIYIANRTPAKARALASLKKFATANVTGMTNMKSGIDGGDYAHIEGEFDIIINATSAGLGGELPPLMPHCIGAQSVVYDMLYGRQPTLFMQWARANGAREVCDGLGMLVEQGAESFYCWHRKRPDTAPVIAALRQN